MARAGIKTRCELCYNYYNYVFILWLVLVLKLGVNYVITITTIRAFPRKLELSGATCGFVVNYFCGTLT